jgi:hypothetical protein
MKTQTLPYKKHSEQDSIDMVNLYNEAMEDYKFWSHNFNMHLEHYKYLKTSIFKRDSMLNEMNNQVLKRLTITTEKHHLIDLGCGMGAQKF